MSYRIDPGAPLDAEIRRIATEQIDKASADLAAPKPGEDPHEAIHDARKRVKKLRALLRLARPGAEAVYAAENARLRDAARRLSPVRDRAALIEALDALREHTPAMLNVEAVDAAFSPLRRALEIKRDAAIAAEGDLGAIVAETQASLAAARDAMGVLVFRRPLRKPAAIAAEGLSATHGKARAALAKAERTGAPDDLHALRRHVKYLGFHLGLLAPLWPAAFEPLRQEAAGIADGLGRDHDYAVLRAEIEAEPDGLGQTAGLSLVAALMDRRQAELQAEGLVAARRLLADRPKAVKARIRRLFADAARLSRGSAETAPEAPRLAAE